MSLPLTAKFRVLAGAGLADDGDFLFGNENPMGRFCVNVLGKKVKKRVFPKGLLNVKGWAVQPKYNEVAVSRDDFKRAKVGSTAVVKIWPGALGARWYTANVPASDKSEERKDEKRDQNSLGG